MTLNYPIKHLEISQKFGEDNTNNEKRSEFYSIFDNKHPGIDFKLPEGSEVYAAYPGIVVRKEFHKGMGNVLGTRNGNIILLYAHLQKFNIELGQKVKIGDLIGFSGNTGNATTEPHLHLELRDITKENLKEMVFEPIFNKPIKQFKETFTYKINNTNKTLLFLAQRYFGDKNYWKKILEINPSLNSDPAKIIPDNTIITIPNY